MARRTATTSSSVPSEPPDDTRRILDALRRIVRDLRRPDGSTRGGPALGPARLFVLQQLAEHGALGVGELAQRTHTDPSSVSIVVRELVSAGLVSRATDPDDHRRAVLALTTAGKAAIRKAPKAAQHQLVAAIEGLGASRRKSLARLLDALVEATHSDPRAPLFFEDGPKKRASSPASASRTAAPRARR